MSEGLAVGRAGSKHGGYGGHHEWAWCPCVASKGMSEVEEAAGAWRPQMPPSGVWASVGKLHAGFEQENDIFRFVF